MKSQGRRESGHFFPRLLQHDQSYRGKAMDTHEPRSWIWAPFILPLWPGVKHDTRRCETGTPSLLPTVTLSLRPEEQQLTTCKASEDKPEAPHGLQSESRGAGGATPRRLQGGKRRLPYRAQEAGGSDSTGLRTRSPCGKACPSLRWQQSGQTALGPTPPSPGARPKGRDGEDAVPAPKAVSMGKSLGPSAALPLAAPGLRAAGTGRGLGRGHRGLATAAAHA